VVERDKLVMGAYAVAGQFQQLPAPRSGATFEWHKFEIVKALPVKPIKTVRYWDKAGTKDGGARTAGVKMSVYRDGTYYVVDVVAGQWEAAARERIIKQTAQLDGHAVEIWVEEEGGSGGKESAQSTIKNLAGYNIRSDRPTGDKALRAEPYAVQVGAGNVKILEGAWNKLFIDEHKTFPRGKYKDQIDAASGAFSKTAIANIDYGKLL
jgi:predicted phage terminase large subunit-like protein